MTTLRDKLYAILRWSEKYTKTDMVYLARGSFWYSTGQAAASLSTFVLATAFANLVPQEVYGTYKYILSIAAMFAIFTLPNLTTATSRAAAQGHGGVIHDATHARMRFSFIGVLCALLGSAYYFWQGNVQLSIALLVIAATLPVFDTFTGYLAYLNGIRRFDLATLRGVSTQIISALVLVAVLFVTDNLILILLGYFVPLALVRFFQYRYVARTIPPEPDARITHETLSYGKHLTAMNVISVLSENVDKILLWKFFGPVQVAVYTFALAIPEQIKGPLKGVMDIAFPKFATQTPEDISANLPALYRKLIMYGLVLLSISILYVLAAPFIFSLLFPQYMDSVLYSQIFMLASVFLVGTIPLTILSAHRKIKEQYVMTTLQPILQVAAFAICIPLWGIMGAIIARVILRVFYLGASLVLLNRVYSTKRLKP